MSMKTIMRGALVACCAAFGLNAWAELTPDFLYTGSGNGSTTGWFTGWDGEGFANNRRAIGPGDMGLVFAADHVNDSNKWHPYKGYQVPETFSIALYTDLSVVSNPDTETAALFAAGRNSGDRAILYKHGNKVGLATNGGDVETDIPTEGGYHLYTMTYTSDKITIAIDNGTPVEKTGTFARPATGFQIAGIYGGVGIWNNPRGLPVAAVVGFAKVLTADDMTELTTTYPATAETSLSSELAYNQNGGIIYAGTITHSSKLSIKRGMLTISAGADCKVKAIDFGDTQGSDGTFGLDLDGALTITGVSSKSDANQGNNSVKNAYVNGEGGFLGGDWEGSGTYNIRGTLTIADSYMQPIHDAGMQTYNIEDGGVLIVKGIQAGTFHAKSTPQHVFNVKNGGLLQVKTALSLGTINAVVEEGGTLELTNTFDHMLNNSNLGGVTCAGKLKLTGTNWVMLPNDATKAANLAAIAEIENNISGTNGQLLMPNAKTYTIGSLSGTGGVRADYSDSAARTLKIVQSKDTTWSGAVKDDGNAARIINFEVASENGSTLTMSGTYTGNNVRTGVLTVDEGGAVKLTKVWPTAGFNVNGTLTIEHGVWQPVYMVKGTGTINWAGTNTFSVNAADGDDALILDGTTINQTAGTLSLRAPGNRTDDSQQDNIGYIKNATITSSSTLSCSGKVGVKGACSITKTAGACSISTIELSEADATLVLDGATMTVTSGVEGMDVSYDESTKTYSLVEAPKGPTATVTPVAAEDLPSDIDAAYVFTIGETAEGYEDYDANFEVSFNRAIEKDSVVLKGSYGAYIWQQIDMPKALAANEVWTLLPAGTVNYGEVMGNVVEFTCGVKNYAAANAGATMTVELVLTKEGAEKVVMSTTTYTLTHEDVTIAGLTVTAETPVETIVPAAQAEKLIALGVKAPAIVAWAQSTGSTVLAGKEIDLEAFALNCTPEGLSTAKDNFKVDITVDADGTVHVSAPDGYNIEPTILGSETVDGAYTEDNPDAKFFKAVIEL